MKSIKYISLFLLCVFFAINCREDSVLVTEEDTTLPDTENVKFQFQLSNESGQPINNAQVMMNSDVYTSDENGIVLTNPYKISSLGLRSEINAPGFEPLIKTVNGPKDGIVKEKIILFKAIETIISTGESGNIDGEGRLTLPDKLIAADGSTYSGEVTVKSKYLNPDDKDFLLSAPGNLLALNTSNQYQQLASLGMYSIELYDSNGGKLNVPDGNSAIIEFPIAEVNKDALGAEVPLWFFDEDSGAWVEEGVAHVEGNKIIAEVSHFTWWNCDIPYDFAPICLIFLDSEGEPLTGLEVGFNVNGVGFGKATTDANGAILAYIPIGESVVLTYYINGEEISTQTIGPFGENTRKDVVNTNLSINSIVGVGLDCEENAVVNGYCYYQSTNGLTSIPIGPDGSFKYLAPGVEHDLILIDKDDNKIAEITISEDSQAADLDLGEISVCGQENLTKVAGRVLVDTDFDNIGETPLSGAKIRFLNVFVDDEIATTDINGYYEINLLPGIEYAMILTTFGYVPIASGDNSPEGNVPNEEFLVGSTVRGVLVPQDETDADNDIWAIEDGEGTISGTMMGDTDADGIGDTPLEWSTLKHKVSSQSSSGSIHVSLVESDGTFSFEYFAGYRNLTSYLPIFNHQYIVDWDTTPDPDGDDSSLGSNGVIPVILYKDEVDSDNKFVIDISNTYMFLCRVLEDTDADGIGDVPIEDISINARERGSTDITITRTTDFNGIAFINNSTFNSNYAEITLEIESTEYEVINIMDTSSDNDNDPFIIDGDVTKMEIDLEKGEWDAGNIFVVRKI